MVPIGSKPAYMHGIIALFSLCCRSNFVVKKNMHKIVANTLILLFAEYSGVAVTILADLVSGLRKSRREGRKLTSRGLRRSVRKLASYYLTLFSLSIVDAMVMIASVVYNQSGHTFPVATFPFLTTLGAVSLALIEIKSICENSPHSDIFRQAADIARRLRGIK